MTMNQQKARDLALGTGVHPDMLALLRRASGLELLDVGQREVVNVGSLPARYPAPPFAQAVDIVADLRGTHVVYRITTDVLYPAPGWSGEEREGWEDVLVCQSRCLFPEQCACYPQHSKAEVAALLR